MKKLHLHLLKASNWIVAGVICAVGYAISSCNALESGSPYAEYEIAGKVLDRAGKPVSGIEIKYGMTYKSMFDSREILDTIAISRTNIHGEYHVTFTAYPDHRLRIIATDIDGIAHDSFQNDTVDIIINGFKGKKRNKYEGKATVSVPDIRLKTTAEQKK